MLVLASILLFAILIRPALGAGGTVVAWGDFTHGQTAVPAGLTNAVAIAASDNYSLALKSDGTVVAWGDTWPVPADLTNAVAIATSFGHSLALKRDGTVVAWGSDTYGETHVPPGLSNVVAIGTGWCTSFAVTSDGTIVGWGLNQAYELAIPPDLTNAIAVAGTLARTSWALTSDGSVVQWGLYSGPHYWLSTELGNMMALSASPSAAHALRADGTVVDGPPNWPGIVALASSDSFNVGLKPDGTLVSGDAPSWLNDVVQIALGARHTLAIVEDGSPHFVRSLVRQTPYRGATFVLNANAVGTPPLSYQWLFNGTNLAGATDSLLIISNAQPSQDGRYSVTVSNLQGSLTGPETTLEVLTCPPLIAGHSPDDQLAVLDTNLTLWVHAGGPVPMTYQWRFNGTDIPEATNSSLEFRNVQVSDEGWYTVTVSNAFYGTSVRMHVTAGDLAGALNARNVFWENNYGWTAQTVYTHDGVAAGASGPLGLWRTFSALNTRVEGPCTLSFWWALARAWDFDKVTFSIDNAVQSFFYADPGRDPTWAQLTFYLPEGLHGLEWRLTEGSSANHSYKKLLLDQVVYSPGPTLPIITTSPTDEEVPATGSATFTVSALGTPPLTYQWLFNGVALPSATNTSLAITGVQATNAGTYTAAVGNAYGTNTSSAILTVIPVPPKILRQPLNVRVPPNGNASLSVLPTGSVPFAYQWEFNGAAITGATDSVLALSRVQIADGGEYRVIVRNDYGAITSATATLTVASLIAWGSNSGGQTTIPQFLTNAAAVAGGSSHSVALDFNGTVTPWGDNYFGQANAPAGLSNVVAIASGLYHNLALAPDGTVAAWGAGTTASSRYPFTNPNCGQAMVPGDLAGVSEVAGGGYHSLVLSTNGTLTAWGFNGSGQTNVPAGLSNVVAIAAGGFHNLALKNNGAVVAWGAGTNVRGNFAYGQSMVPAGLSNVVSIAAGEQHSVALKDDGTVIAWGDTYYGQTRVPAGLSNVVGIVAGGYHTLALTHDGEIVAWGDNQFGQLNVPVAVSNVVGLGAGLLHSLAIMNDGTPVVLRRSPDQILYAGMTARCSVGAVGAPDLHYQWQFDGGDINGATNAALVLTNVSLTAQGFYRCAVSNGHGSALSPPITLTVLRTQPRFESAFPGLQMTNGDFRLQLDGLSGHGSIILWASTNLTDWQAILTNPPITGSGNLIDQGAANFPLRFYRAAEQ